MKKTVLLCSFSIFAAVSEAALVEWVSPEKYLNAPVCEADKDGGFPQIVRYKLAKAGHQMLEKTWDQAGDGDLLVWFNIEKRKIFKRISLIHKKQILLNLEPPINEPFSLTETVLKHFDRVFTWNDGIKKNEKVHKIHYPVRNLMGENLPSFKSRKICAMVLSNNKSTVANELYSKRRELVSFYESLPDGEEYFHLYGRKWNKKPLKTYRGTPVDTTETLMGYRFAFAFENWSNDVGYITEKIFCAFAAGNVPVYLGASNVAEYIPADCFIDARKFDSFQAIHDFLLSMKEEEWLSYQQRIRRYLESEKGALFSRESVAELLVQQIIQCLGE